MPVLSSLAERLAAVYADQAETVAARVAALVDEYRRGVSSASQPWSQRDIVLITYADQVRGQPASPIANLADWLQTTQLDQLLSIVHLLPFCPWSSDDGFSVIDYLQVDPAAGTWDDIDELRDRVDLMFDLVLNHISSESEWFARYRHGEDPYMRFFIEVDSNFDTSQVVRPRSLPLVTPVMTTRGTREVWTTFSEDQIDLNYAEPELLLAMLRVLLEYARRGARIIRLDAIAFLWKTSGTSCVHLPQTHEVVKVMRDVVEATFPGTLLLTETNVPHAENVSYFGAGDEAHMVYQFSLPPLLIDAFVHGDAVWLRKWLVELVPAPAGCTFFNFTASHDGIGVRPLEGLVPEERLTNVVAEMSARGGLIGTRRRPDGEDVPYELNISYVSALSPTISGEASDIRLHAQRFLATQAVMLSLAGVPAVYFHSLVGSTNDAAAAKQTGINRRINRRKFERQELDAQLADVTSLAGQIFRGYQKLLAVRRRLSAFHPDAAQRVVVDTPDAVLAFARTSLDGHQHVLVATNFSNEPVVICPRRWLGQAGELHNLLADNEAVDGDSHTLAPGECAWIGCGCATENTD